MIKPHCGTTLALGNIGQTSGKKKASYRVN